MQKEQMKKTYEVLRDFRSCLHDDDLTAIEVARLKEAINTFAEILPKVIRRKLY